MGSNKNNMTDEEKPIIKKPFKGAKVNWPADMPSDMLEDAIQVSKKALEEHDFETQGIDIAQAVKKHMDENYEPYWHVFCGKAFGCHAVHERNRFCYFSFDASKIAFLVYKAS